MQIKITNEQPFQVLSTNFTISPSSSGYDLYFSADGVEYSKLFTVGANTNRQVTQVAAGSYYFLSGNTDTVTVNWMKNCGGSGSGGSSYVLPVASENTLGGVKIGSGITIDANGVISADVQSGGAQEVKTIVLSGMFPAEFTEDDIDAMQEMVDYLAEFPADNLPAARILAGGFYYTLLSLWYDPEDTENQTPEQRHLYEFSSAKAYGEEGFTDESENGWIGTFILNAENVEESYYRYWDSSENKTKKLSAVEDLQVIDDPLGGDVAARKKSSVEIVHIDWDSLLFEGENIFDVGNLENGNITLFTWDNNGTDTLSVENGVDSYDIVNDGDSATLPYTGNLSWYVLRDGRDVTIILTNGSSKVPFEESLITRNDCDAQYDVFEIPDGLYQYDGDNGTWTPLAKSIVINDILDGGADKVAEFYDMMKPLISGGISRGWGFNLFYRTKFFGINYTLAPLSTAWINDMNSIGNKDIALLFEYMGYAHDFSNSQAPNRVLIGIAEDGSYNSDSWDGITPSNTRVGYVRFGNDDRGGLTYDADNDRFEYDSQYIATGDTTTVYDDLIDNRMTDNLFENALIDNNLACLNTNLLYVVESGETTQYSQPLLSRKTFSSPVTIDGRDFYKEITYNYSDWKLTALYGANDGNNGANLRITALP